MNTIIGIISIIFGASFILFNKRLAKKFVSYNYKYRERYGEVFYQNASIAFGIIWILMGILAVFHLVHIKGT